MTVPRSASPPRLLAAAFLALGLAAPAAAQPADREPPPWRGTWTTDEGGPRALEVRGPRTHLRVDWPGHGEVTLSGVARGDQLELWGRLPAGRGITGALEGAEAVEARAPLRLHGRRQPDGLGGWEVHVRYEQEGEVLRRERWWRPGPGGLEILSVEPEGPWDPKVDGPLRIRFRVTGRPLLLRTGVRLPRQDRVRRDLYGGPWVHRDVPCGPEGGRFPPGEHELTWDGRDHTSARRIVMAGPCRLELVAAREEGVDPDAPPPRDARVIQVERPLYALLGSVWPRPAWFGGGIQWDPRPALDLGGRRAGFLGYRERVVEPVGPEDLFEALRTAAAVEVFTHGTVDAVETYEGPPHHFDPTKLNVLTAEAFDEFLAGRPPAADAKPLRDLGTVIFYSCELGADPASLPSTLVSLGADCVVSFEKKVLVSSHLPWQKRLSLFLGSGRTLKEASWEAARYADAQTWKELPALQRSDLRQRRNAAPLAECLTYTVGAGIDPAKLRLTPARYGVSTN